MSGYPLRTPQYTPWPNLRSIGIHVYSGFFHLLGKALFEKIKLFNPNKLPLRQTFLNGGFTDQKVV
ncbi:hypothetical protein PHSC3_001036 [Chlamydiales bacterium STE3]|nr:hypothetical protein PHSC3_001036 [Chlamydiales bacterium STE3]